jgi:hypothetical protein
MERTTRWLAEIGLPEYTPLFIENDLDFGLLCELTDQDLKELGVTSLGHRRRMMRAIAELKSSVRLRSELHSRHRWSLVTRTTRSDASLRCCSAIS